jgi:hypothetical protein
MKMFFQWLAYRKAFKQAFGKKSQMSFTEYKHETWGL